MLPLIIDAADDPPELINIIGTRQVPPNYNMVTIRAVTLSNPSISPLFNHKLIGFVEFDVPKYNDITLRAHFRMTRSMFQVFTKLIFI